MHPKVSVSTNKTSMKNLDAYEVEFVVVQILECGINRLLKHCLHCLSDEIDAL